MRTSSTGRATRPASSDSWPPSAKYADPETLFGLEGRWADVPEGAYDPAARAAELDREGIEAEILYTSVGLGLFGLTDLEFRHACFRAFNDWLAEHCAGAPKRLFGVAMVAIDDIDRSVTELERCVDMGLRGAMISIGQRSGENYGDPRFDKFWSAVEALEVPISLHVAATETSWTNTSSRFVDFSCVFTPTMYAITSMIFSGLFDRHPKVKVLSVENDASWPLAVLERMDDRWTHDKLWAAVNGEASGITSGRMPSQIFHDHVACTFMRDRTAIVNREIIGRENLMWGADFPHFDGAWPDSAALLEAAIRRGVSRGSDRHRAEQRDQVVQPAARARHGPRSRWRVPLPKDRRPRPVRSAAACPVARRCTTPGSRSGRHRLNDVAWRNRSPWRWS